MADSEHQKPANEKLWHAIVTMARARFRVYPSPAAAHWVHATYVQKGGQFIDTSKKKKKHR